MEEEASAVKALVEAQSEKASVSTPNNPPSAFREEDTGNLDPAQLVLDVHIRSTQRVVEDRELQSAISQ